MKLFLKISGILIALMLLVFVFFTLYVKNLIDNKIEINQEDYKFSKNSNIFKNVKNNKNFTLDLNENDTLYYFHFWATYCKPCIEEFEEINKNYDKIFKGKTRLILVSFEDINKQRTFLEKRNYKMEFYTVDSSSFFIKPNIKYLPTTIISKNQTIKEKVIGKYNW